MAEVTEVCDRVIFLKVGLIIAEDTPENLAGRVNATLEDFFLAMVKKEEE